MEVSEIFVARGERAAHPVLMDGHPSPPTSTQSPTVFPLDFWVETVPYLSSRNLLQLSCTSQPIYRLVWTCLIPSSPHGLTFSPFTPPEHVENCLSRVPSLKHLGLQSLRTDSPVVSLLTKLIHLSSVVLPQTRSGDAVDNVFPFPHVSHLTSLTRIKWTQFAGSIPRLVEESPSFTHFVNLRHLALEGSSKWMFPEIYSALTNLETLNMRVSEDLLHPLSHLTNLTSLTWSGTDIKYQFHNDFNYGFKQLTKLTQLHCPSWYGDEILHLTNLESLHVKFTPELLSNTSKTLTKLSNWVIWEVGDLDADSMRTSCTDFALLTNLTALTIPHFGLSRRLAEILSALPKLERLKIDQEHTGMGQEGEEHLPLLTQLKDLVVILDPSQTWAVSFLTNLTHLDIPASQDYIIFDDSTHDLRFLEPLTNLTSLRMHAPYGFSSPTVSYPSITSLELFHSKFPSYEFFSALTGLKRLYLHQVVCGTQGAEAIARFLTQLEDFGINKKSGETWDLLSPLISLPRLQHLGPLALEATQKNQEEVVPIRQKFWDDYRAHQSKIANK